MISEKQAKTDLGRIKIHVQAISSIASLAALEIEGVVRIYAGSLVRLLEFLGRENTHPAVKIELKENNEINIGIPIIVEYGQDVPRVAALVQENVRQAVEKMTGLLPVNIDVKVKGIEKAQRRKT
jgi:uncharacterized alkaline shock family protein YloU